MSLAWFFEFSMVSNSYFELLYGEEEEEEGINGVPVLWGWVHGAPIWA